MKEKSTKTPSTAIFSVLITLVIYIGAVLIYFYANGWRIDPFNQEVLKTGVLTVESDPNFSDVSLNNESKGRTPKSISLDIGEYDVKVSKDGYIDWNKKVDIKEEKSTPVFPWLIKSNIESTEVFNQEEKLLKSWINTTHDHLLFLTYTQTNKSHNYKLWNYDINRAFWDLTENPQNILTLNNDSELDIDLNLSVSGEYAILNIQGEENNNYLLHTTRQASLDNINKLDLSNLSNYEITWSQDDKYILFESEQDLISYDLNKGTKYLLIKKDNNQNYIWTTDTKGFLYTLEENKTQDIDNIYSYNLIQKELDGSNSKTLIKNIYFQKNEEYINKYREDRKNTETCICEPFTNSPECTQTVGNIEYINVHQEAKGIYIKTTYATYWYDIEADKYLMITPYPSKLIEYSIDNNKLIFENTNGTYIFTFDKEDADHTVEIGSKRIANINDFSKTSNFKWLSNSSYISYIEENNMYVSDKDGDNKTKLLESIDQYTDITITFSKEDIVTLEEVTDDKDNISTILKTYSLN